MQNLHIKKTEFQKFLTSLSKLNDASIFSVKNDRIDALAASEDNSMYLWASLSGDFDAECFLNLPSLKKLSDSMKLISTEEISFKLHRNHLEYKGSNIRFKYHLYDDGILTRPKVSLEKIKSFTYDVEFETSKDYFSTVIKNSSLTGTDKLYLYTEDGKLVWNLADNTITNSNSLTLIGEDVDFELEPFTMKIDNVKILAFISDEIKIRINSKIGIGNIVCKVGDLELNYIISSLVK